MGHPDDLDIIPLLQFAKLQHDRWLEEMTERLSTCPLCGERMMPGIGWYVGSKPIVLPPDPCDVCRPVRAP